MLWKMSLLLSAGPNGSGSAGWGWASTHKTCHNPRLATCCPRASPRPGAGCPTLGPPRGCGASEESLVTASHHSQLGQPPRQDGRASSWTADFSFPLCPVQKPKDLSGRLVLMRLRCYPQFAQYFIRSSPQRRVALCSIQRLGPTMHWNRSKQLPPKLQTSAAWQSQ